MNGFKPRENQEAKDEPNRQTSRRWCRVRSTNRIDKEIGRATAAHSRGGQTLQLGKAKSGEEMASLLED